MKLKQTSFYAIYKDARVLTTGHEFGVKGRRLAVHKTRPALLPADKFYKVSELTAGFAVPILPTLVRSVAVRSAISAMSEISDEDWQNEIRRHLAIGTSLPVKEV